MLLMQAQENKVALDEEQLLFPAADDCDALDYDVDEAPTAQTMFMANLSSADHVYDEAGPSYDSDILSEVHDHDHYQDAVCEHHEEHAMHDNVQLNRIVDSYADYTSDSNIILYDQYVKDNAVPGVHSNEQVELYERRAMFELTEREQKINEQLRIVITDRNFKEETLKKELHSIKLQLASTINHNKLMVAIGYKNPLCLTRARQVWPALYNGHEIIKDNHVPAIVHNTKDTLEIAKMTRRKMNENKKDQECVNHKTIASRPIKALTVYPPNTPATLVPRVLPKKSQVKIHIFTLIQLFLEFDKTYKKELHQLGSLKGKGVLNKPRNVISKSISSILVDTLPNFIPKDFYTSLVDIPGPMVRYLWGFVAGVVEREWRVVGVAGNVGEGGSKVNSNLIVGGQG
uniref:Integrase, catalytic region, zinc finger, CCHC-type, peptidase aspartic, catalytic n=1 Tax=Tanacetum cinerariifolium TaxID=118510 RepID=A0A6L2M798_TANCI|nr:hypothetical protein [Tanacetum cinerariifolium]